MLTVGVLYPAANCRIHALGLFKVCYMAVYSYMESSYTITWAFCIVRLFQLGQCEGLRVVGWARRIPRFLFCKRFNLKTNETHDIGILSL